MRHPRVRRPFIVESRGSGRDGNSIAIPKRAQQSIQAQSKPAALAATAFFDPWAAVTAPVEPSAAPRRILPNIMTPPEPDPVEIDLAVPTPDEAPLPRVQRAKVQAPRKAPQAPRTVAQAPRAASKAASPVPAPMTPVAVASLPQTVAAPQGRPMPRPDRSDRAALPAGQRWKARLPRACW